MMPTSYGDAIGENVGDREGLVALGFRLRVLSVILVVLVTEPPRALHPLRPTVNISVIQ
jgi:hypothetical protein